MTELCKRAIEAYNAADRAVQFGQSWNAAYDAYMSATAPRYKCQRIWDKAKTSGFSPSCHLLNDLHRRGVKEVEE